LQELSSRRRLWPRSSFWRTSSRSLWLRLMSWLSLAASNLAQRVSISAAKLWRSCVAPCRLCSKASRPS